MVDGQTMTRERGEREGKKGRKEEGESEGERKSKLAARKSMMKCGMLKFEREPLVLSLQFGLTAQTTSSQFEVHIAG